MRLGKIIEKPIVTEKSIIETEHNRYTFKVNKKATKNAIAKAVNDMFDVDVVAVRTRIMPGKKRRIRNTFQSIKTSSWKKATVTVADGQKIDMFTKLIGGEK